MRGRTNKSPIKLSAVENKLTQWFVYKWGKPTRQKPHRVILRSPLPKFHYYHNKWLQVKESQYLIPTYSWTLIPIPNWTCSVVTISPFDAWLPVRNFNLQLKKVVGYKVLQFIHDENQEDAWSQNPRCTNITTSSHEWWTRANSVSGHNLLEQTLLNTCATCEHFDGP